MKLRTHLLVFLLFILFRGSCQVDPFWLKSWEEANKNKPESIVANSRIAPEGEPGIPFKIQGEVYEPNGSPAEGVVVHAYHRDMEGFDFGPGDNTTSTWRLQGWARTDEEGRFQFKTIRPSADHLGREGAHIHLTLVSEDFGRQWAPTVYLAGDPLITKEQIQRSLKKGEFGPVKEVVEVDGIQYIMVKIKLKAKGDF